MSQNLALAALAAGCALLLAGILSGLVGRSPEGPRGRRMSEALALLALGCGVGAGTVALVSVSGQALIAAGLALPLITMTALGTVILCMPVQRLAYPASVVVVFGGVAALLVVAPVHWALFSTHGLLQSTLGTFDLGGATAAVFAPSLVALTVLALEKRSRGRGPGEAAPALRRPRTVSSVLVTATAGVTWFVWIGWMLGMELAFDEISPRILLGGVLAPVCSIGAWLLVQRLRHAATTRTAAVAGLLTGLAAITSASGYVDPVGACVIGLVSGAAGSLIAHSLVSGVGGAAWLIPTSLAVGSAVGIGSIGVFSTRVGLAYTGQPELLFSQVATLAITGGYSVVVGGVAWLVIRRLSRNAPASAVA